MKTTRILAAAALTSLFILGGLPQRPIGHAAAASPVKGGTVIDGLYEEPDRLIPNTSSETFSEMAQRTIFTPLFYTDDNGVLHPGLASQIPTIANGGISRDSRTYTFHLRPGLKWSDGQPLDARDVDYAWRLWLNKDLIVNTTVGLDQIKSATVSADRHSITFHLKAPYSPFVAVWTDQNMPLPAHVLSKMTAKALNTSSFTHMPSVSSGPFRMVARKAGYSITEVRNPNYYRKGLPYLDKLIFRIIPDQTAMTNALRAHEVDCGWFLDVSQANILQHLPGYTYVAAAKKTANIEQALLNLKNPIFQDVRVRQALEYGINRPAMVKDVRHGEAILAGADEAPALWSYNPNAKPYPYDPARAAKLLDAAGWKMGADGFRHKNGQKFSVRYSTTAHNIWRAQDERTSDMGQRKAILGQIQMILNHDLPALWLYHPPDVAEHRNTLHNYAPAPFSAETWNSSRRGRCCGLRSTLESGIE